MTYKPLKPMKTVGYPDPRLHLFNMPKPTDFTIRTAQGPISISVTTGEVTLPAGMQISEGARLFWAALANARTEALQPLIEQRAQEKFDKRWAQALKTKFPKLLQEEINRAVKEVLDRAYMREAFYGRADGDLAMAYMEEAVRKNPGQK